MKRRATQEREAGARTCVRRNAPRSCHDSAERSGSHSSIGPAWRRLSRTAYVQLSSGAGERARTRVSARSSVTIRWRIGRARRTDPSTLTSLFGEVELVGEPRKDAVRIPHWNVRIVQPDCDGVAIGRCQPITPRRSRNGEGRGRENADSFVCTCAGHYRDACVSRHRTSALKRDRARVCE